MKVKVTITFEFDDSFDKADIAEHVHMMLRKGVFWFQERIMKIIARQDEPQPFDVESQRSLEEDLERYEQATETIEIDYGNN